MKKNYVYWVLALIFICIPELKARADRYKESPKKNGTIILKQQKPIILATDQTITTLN